MSVYNIIDDSTWKLEIIIWNIVNVYEHISSISQGLIIANVDEDEMLFKATALYREYDEITTQEDIERIAEQIDRLPEFTCELITACLRNTLFIPFYKEYYDEDSEETAEDVISAPPL